MIAIVKSCGANLTSLEYALNRLGRSFVTTDDSALIQSATHVILPGVGHAARAMQQLKQNALDQLIPTLKQPVLGICLGMQLLFEKSQEGHAKCLGLFPQEVRRFPQSFSLSIPHMGWNRLQFQKDHPLLEGIEPFSHVYFVHSYYAEKNEYCLASTLYGIAFSSIIARQNFYGMQFHPEKSAQVGSRLLQNFLNLRSSL